MSVSWESRQRGKEREKSCSREGPGKVDSGWTRKGVENVSARMREGAIRAELRKEEEA